MHRRFDNCWLEYRDSIESMDRPSNMEIDFCWYQKGPNNELIYDLINHFMANLKTIIT